MLHRCAICMLLCFLLAVSEVSSVEVRAADPSTATGPTKLSEQHAQQDVKLPDEPKSIVLTKWSAMVYNPQNERRIQCEIRGDGSAIFSDGKKVALSGAELQSLLRFVVREKSFFDIGKDQVHLDPATAALRGPYTIEFLRVEADGRQNEVKYLLEKPPRTREVENLKAILARLNELEREKAGAQGKNGKQPRATSAAH